MPRVSPPPGAPAGDAIRGSALGHQPELVEKFLELYGGTISFTTIPGKGTIFTFTIPDRSPGEGTNP